MASASAAWRIAATAPGGFGASARPLQTPTRLDALCPSHREISWRNGVGFARVHQALWKLNIKSVPHNTVKAIRSENGRDAGSQRGKGTWDSYLKIHTATPWKGDSFSNKVLTHKGLRGIFVLVFLHVDTRRVLVTGAS